MTDTTKNQSAATDIWLQKWGSMGVNVAPELEALFSKAMQTYSDFLQAPNTQRPEVFWQNIFSLVEKTQPQAVAFASEISNVLEQARSDFEAQLKTKNATSDIRASFDLWIDCCERAYQQRAGTSEFCSLLADLVNASFQQNKVEKFEFATAELIHNTKTEAGISKRELIFEQDDVKLYRYQSAKASKTKRQPLLIVYALINRPYMMDLQPDKSIIANLLAQNLDVYLIDWGYPTARHQERSLNDHLNVYLDACVNHVCKLTRSRKISLLGVCQGGTFSLCYAAMHSKKIKRLITMVTPVDFHRDEFLLSRWVQQIDVEAITEKLGNIPGQFLNQAFIALKPFRLGLQKYVHLMDYAQETEKFENFMRMEQWIFDSPDQCARTFKEFVELFFKQNRLLNGDLHIGKTKVDLSNIKCPVLNIYARDDHLVPPSSSKALAPLLGSAISREFEFSGGHIGIFVSRRGTGEISQHIAGWVKLSENKLGTC